MQPNPSQQQAYDTIRQWVQQAQPADQVQHDAQQGHPNHLLRTIMYLLQGVDALNTANFLKKPGTYETDPLMKPFAQAGNPAPMMGAYGLEDKAIGGMSPGAQNAASILQILLNLGGILRTQHARKTGH